MQDGSAIAIIIQAQQQKQLVRLAQSVQRQEDYDTAVKPTFYQGYDQNTGTAIATTQGFSTSNKYRVITNAPLSNGDRVNIRPSNGLDRVDAISTRKRQQQQVPKIKIAKAKVTGEGNASYDSDTDSYILTTTEAPTVAQVGGISNFTKVKDPLFRFDFEFRIYGNTTPLFADGLAFSYTPSPLGAAGAALGVGALGLGFACGIKTFFGDAQQDRNQVRAFGQFSGGFTQSGNALSLRSPSWQSASIQVLSNSVNFSFGGVELNLVMPTPPLDYFLRISAATAQHNDNHEVRNLRLNGRRVRFVPPVPLVPPP